MIDDVLLFFGWNPDDPTTVLLLCIVIALVTMLVTYLLTMWLWIGPRERKEHASMERRRRDLERLRNSN